MSLLPETASFHERVQDLFAAYRGKGLSLSALDVELVDEWANTGAPFEVVARGMRQAAEASLFDAADGEPGLRSLRACRRKVEAEIKKYLARAASDVVDEEERSRPVEPLHVARVKKLKAALKKIAKEHPALATATARLKDAIGEPEDFDQAQRAEELTLAVLLRALPWPERSRLLREAGVLVQKVSGMSSDLKRESIRFHRGALLKHTLSLPSFW